MTQPCNCYALETTLATAEEMRSEFGLGPMHTWLAQVRGAELRQVVLQLILKLDRMSRVALSMTERRNVLRAVERPLSDAMSKLTKLAQKGRPPGLESASSLALEQRLYCLVVKNLKQLREDVDAYTRNLGVQRHNGRRWVVQNLFFYLGRQIEFGLSRGVPLPPNTWLELHQLYTYASAQGIRRAEAHAQAGPGDDFDPDREYKRMLLLGLAGRLLQDRYWGEFVHQSIAHWVAETSLGMPSAYVGELDLHVVETSKDGPPRQVKGALKESFRGWVLMRRAGFLSDEILEMPGALIARPPSDRRYAVGGRS